MPGGFRSWRSHLRPIGSSLKATRPYPTQPKNSLSGFVRITGPSKLAFLDYDGNAMFNLERIHDSLHRDPGIDPEQVARAVLAMLMARLPAAEVEDAKAVSPKSLHNLWPS